MGRNMGDLQFGMTFSPRVLFFALKIKVLLMKETLAIKARRKLSTKMQLIHFANSPERVELFLGVR